MKNRLVKTSESEVKVDKGQRNYKTVEFTPIGQFYEDVPGFGRVIVHGKSRSTKINIFEKSYLNNKEEFGYSLPLNTVVEGTVETREVEPYTFTSKHPTTGAEVIRQANNYTAVVIGDPGSPAYQSLVNATFKNRGHVVLNSASVSEAAEPSTTPASAQATKMVA